MWMKRDSFRRLGGYYSQSYCWWFQLTLTHSVTFSLHSLSDLITQRMCLNCSNHITQVCFYVLKTRLRKQKNSVWKALVRARVQMICRGFLDGKVFLGSSLNQYLWGSLWGQTQGLMSEPMSVWAQRMTHQNDMWWSRAAHHNRTIMNNKKCV